MEHLTFKGIKFPPIKCSNKASAKYKPTRSIITLNEVNDLAPKQQLV